jgi:hypothetical protein
VKTRGDRKIDHDLHSLPRVEDHGVRRIRGRLQVRGARGQPCCHPRKVAAHHQGTLGKDVPLERVQRRRRASASA